MTKVFNLLLLVDLLKRVVHRGLVSVLGQLLAHDLLMILHSHLLDLCLRSCYEQERLHL